MNKHLQKKDQVSFCYKDSCVHATGKNADTMAKAIAFMFLLIGIGFLARNLSK
ncbi:MAG: hypothetical protein ACO1N0_14895 [Fluviicola sp.]